MKPLLNDETNEEGMKWREKEEEGLRNGRTS
jgi:hypothetical protein